MNRYGAPLVPVSLILRARPAIYPGVIDTGFNVFDGVRGPVYAVATDAQDILIGTKLLRSKVLRIDFSARRVSITPSPLA